MARRLPAQPFVLLAISLLACSAGPEPTTPAPPPAITAPVVAPEPIPTASAAPPATATASAPAPVAKGPSYVVCHCCCGGVEPKKQCLYRSKGDSLDKIIAEDKKPKRPCPPNAGCTMPIEHVYCD